MVQLLCWPEAAGLQSQSENARVSCFVTSSPDLLSLVSWALAASLLETMGVRLGHFAAHLRAQGFRGFRLSPGTLHPTLSIFANLFFQVRHCVLEAFNHTGFAPESRLAVRSGVSSSKAPKPVQYPSIDPKKNDPQNSYIVCGSIIPHQ